MYVMGTLLDPDDHVFVVGMREDEPEEVPPHSSGEREGRTLRRLGGLVALDSCGLDV